MPASRSPTRGCGIFAEHAPLLRAHGLAVVPANIAKRPLVSGWDRWKGPPGPKAIRELAEQFPDANVAIIPGLSKLLVADVDTADQAGEVEELLGRTPLHVLSRRGVHLYYRDPEQHVPGNLRALGLNVDLKRGRSIVIAPPSRHESDAIYRLDDCDWSALRRLPRANMRWLQKAEPKLQASMRDGSRRQWLNDRLCRDVSFCDTFEELLDRAHTLNEEIPRRFPGLAPLPDDVVIKRTRQVWKDGEEGKFERMVGRRSSARTTAAEINKLAAMGRKGSDALMLLMKLRTAHAARVARQETFAIAAEAMAREQTITGWHCKRYRAATKLLLQAGKIILVSKHRPMLRGGSPARYSLVEAS